MDQLMINKGHRSKSQQAMTRNPAGHCQTASPNGCQILHDVTTEWWQSQKFSFRGYSPVGMGDGSPHWSPGTKPG